MFDINCRQKCKKIKQECVVILPRRNKVKSSDEPKREKELPKRSNRQKRKGRGGGGKT
jgi:hypothetical protein